VKPHPPGSYPVVVVGSGPGGVQVAYWLRRMGIGYAHLSADERPGGMFQRFPVYQRLISWTKPYALEERGTEAYERYDWNSLIAEEPEHRALVAGLMDGSSYFPARSEMEAGIVSFVQKTSLPLRYGCRLTGTRRDDGDIVLETSEGDYKCRIAIFAIGATQPWKPAIPGFEDVPHYVEARPAREYAGKRVVIIGKRNSGFELADGLLPWARQILLASPRPATLSVTERSLVGARARYAQPYEDHVLAGGNVVLDVAIERVERGDGGYRVHARGTTHGGNLVLDADEVIAATGFQAPFSVLSGCEVATFNQGRLPAQTPYWESPSAPNIFFAGSITQGFGGLKKYGIPGNSAAVHGFRYNAGVMCRYIARERLGMPADDQEIAPAAVVDNLLRWVTKAPELWHQPSYLCRVIERRGASLVLGGCEPLAAFVDAPGDDAVAITIENNGKGDLYPAVYVRRDGRVTEHVLDPAPFHDFETPEHRAQLGTLVRPLLP